MAIQDIDLGTVIENGEDGDVARTAFIKVNENFDDLDTRVKAIEDLDIGTVTSVNDVLPVDGNVDLTPADIGAATAAQGAKAETAVQADVFATALNQKVDKVEGYQLSQEDYTTEEKNKLAGLESSLFLGVYGSLAELEAAHPTSDRPGEYAFIPAGGNIYMFVWDADTERWVTIGSGSEAITAEQVKTLYESNPDTNAFTNAEKTKLGGIQAGAQVNVATNISQGTRTDTTVGINSSTGTGATLVGASTTEAGIMTAADKVKLNSMPTTTDGLTEGSTNLYFTSARVRQTLLTGLTTGTNAVIAATDSLISALAKLQAQISAKMSNPMTNTGDLITGGTSGNPTRLPIGSAGQVLRVNSSASGLEYSSAAGITYFESPATAWTAGGEITITHNLGVMPKATECWLKLKSAVNGMSIGDEVKVDVSFASSSVNYGPELRKPTTSTISIKIGAQGMLMWGTNGIAVVVTPAQADLIVRIIA